MSKWEVQRERAKGRKRWNTILRVRKDKSKENNCPCFHAEGKDTVGKGILKIKKERVPGQGPGCYRKK